MNKVKLSTDLCLQLPSKYKRFGGTEFILGESGDTIMLKPAMRKPWPAELDDSKPMSMEEIDRVVHEVRKKRKLGKQ